MTGEIESKSEGGLYSDTYFEVKVTIQQILSSLSDEEALAVYHVLAERAEDEVIAAEEAAESGTDDPCKGRGPLLARIVAECERALAA